MSNPAKPDRLPWIKSDSPDGEPSDEPCSAAEQMLLLLAPEVLGFELAPNQLLNNERVKDGHRFAVLDVEGEVLGTAATREGAIEAACLREAKWWREHAAELECRLGRVLGAVKTLQTGGLE